MEKYKVIILKSALNDIEKIYEYIAYDLLSPNSASKITNHIFESISKLQTFPKKYTVLKFDTKNNQDIRRMNVDNYAVFFTIVSNTVKVISVFYGSSNIDYLLNK